MSIVPPLLPEAQTAKRRLDEICYLLKQGLIGYDEAKKQAREPLQILNAYMAKRAKDFGFKHKTISFVGFTR